MAKQILDLSMYEAGDGGELQIINDDLQTVSGLANQVFLAWFGGNTEQSTSADLDELESRDDWWGNVLFESVNQFNSETERTLNNVALNGEGLKKIREAAKQDLQFLSNVADVEVAANIVGLNRLSLEATLIQPGNLSTKLQFIWDGNRNELIENRLI